jgi:hypothetical protein
LEQGAGGSGSGDGPVTPDAAPRQPGLAAVPPWAAGVLVFIGLAVAYSAWLAVTKSGGGGAAVVQLVEIVLGPVLAAVVGLYLVGRLTLFGSRTTGQLVVWAAVVVIAVAQLATQLAAPTLHAVGDYVPSAVSFTFNRDSGIESQVQAQTVGTEAASYVSRLRVFDVSHAGTSLGVLEVYDLRDVSGASTVQQAADTYVGRNLAGATSREVTTMGRTVVVYETPSAGVSVWLQDNLLLEAISASGADAELVARALAGESVP